MSTTDTRAAFKAWAEREGYDTAHTHDGIKWLWLNPMTADLSKAYQAATEAAKATGTAELPPLPEMESVADMPHAQKVPPDWDDDYTSIWQKWQVSERNKMQWRAYALQLRAALAATAAPVLSDEQIKEAAMQAWPNLPENWWERKGEVWNGAKVFALAILAATNRSQP